MPRWLRCLRWLRGHEGDLRVVAEPAGAGTGFVETETSVAADGERAVTLALVAAHRAGRAAVTVGTRSCPSSFVRSLVTR